MFPNSQQTFHYPSVPNTLTPSTVSSCILQVDWPEEGPETSWFPWYARVEFLGFPGSDSAQSTQGQECNPATRPSKSFFSMVEKQNYRAVDLNTQKNSPRKKCLSLTLSLGTYLLKKNQWERGVKRSWRFGLWWKRLALL